jgi:hypothetical protein
MNFFCTLNYDVVKIFSLRKHTIRKNFMLILKALAGNPTIYQLNILTEYL